MDPDVPHDARSYMSADEFKRFYAIQTETDKRLSDLQESYAHLLVGVETILKHERVARDELEKAKRVRWVIAAISLLVGLVVEDLYIGARDAGLFGNLPNLVPAFPIVALVVAVLLASLVRPLLRYEASEHRVTAIDARRALRQTKSYDDDEGSGGSSPPEDSGNKPQSSLPPDQKTMSGAQEMYKIFMRNLHSASIATQAGGAPSENDALHGPTVLPPPSEHGGFDNMRDSILQLINSLAGDVEQRAMAIAILRNLTVAEVASTDDERRSILGSAALGYSKLLERRRQNAPADDPPTAATSTMRPWFASALALTASAAALAASKPNDLTHAHRADPKQRTSRLVADIVVEGAARIEERTVKSYLLIHPGDSSDEDRITLSVRALEATGLFAEVRIEMRGNDLIVRVRENPIIHRVIFEGNNAITTERLVEETEAEPRQTFTLSRVEQDVQRILEVYRRSGRFAANVTPQYKMLPQNRTDVIFSIKEGPSTSVRSISFIGNEAFSDGLLRKVVATGESHSTDAAIDAQSLEQFYFDNGYLDFRIDSITPDPAPERNDGATTIAIHEGEPYSVGEVIIHSEIESLSAPALAQALAFETGQRAGSHAINKARDFLIYTAGLKGYANVEVVPIETRDAKARTVSYVFSVRERERVYIERIDIKGSTASLDQILQREVKAGHDDLFDQTSQARAKRRIASLGFAEIQSHSLRVPEDHPASADEPLIDWASPFGPIRFDFEKILASEDSSKPNRSGRTTPEKREPQSSHLSAWIAEETAKAVLSNKLGSEDVSIAQEIWRLEYEISRSQEADDVSSETRRVIDLCVKLAERVSTAPSLFH